MCVGGGGFFPWPLLSFMPLGLQVPATVEAQGRAGIWAKDTCGRPPALLDWWTGAGDFTEPPSGQVNTTLASPKAAQGLGMLAAR